MTQSWPRDHSVDERLVPLSVTQLRLFLAALEAAGAHEPSGCEGPCPALQEHDAVAVLRDLISDGGGR